MHDRDLEALLTLCQERGFCGPFANHDRYESVPGWEGMADCLVCRNTVLATHHESLRAAGDPRCVAGAEGPGRWRS